MEIKGLSKRLTEGIKKYKFIALIIIAGVLLMTIPAQKEDQDTIKNSDFEEASQTLTLEEELAQILNQVKGAGKVKVMLTVAQGEEVIYQTNDTVSTDSDTTKKDTDTVTVTDADRNQNGLIKQANPPIYLGALIICQGADDPIVKLAITEAVSKITGLKTNCISVLKMK